jgi:DNA-binding protein Fis
MKRIVTFLVPVREGNSSALNGAESNFQTERDPDPTSEMPGTMRVEVVVSDDVADRVINTLLGQPSDAEKVDLHESSIDPVQTLVAQELKDAGADAESLLERIIARVERQLIVQVYQDCDRVKSRAAIRLGINRNTLLKKLRRYNSLASDTDDADDLELDPSDAADAH